MCSICSSASASDPPKPVEPGDDQPVAEPGLDALDGPQQQWPVGAPAGFVELFEDLDQAGVVQQAPGLHAFVLQAGEMKLGPERPRTSETRT
jgi:hypothetical protein